MIHIIPKFIKSDISHIFLIGTNIKYTYDELLKNGFNKQNISIFDDESKSHENISKFLKSGDVILLKASNGMKLINIVNYLKTL